METKKKKKRDRFWSYQWLSFFSMQLFFKSIKCIGKNNNKKKHLSRFRGKKENKRAMSTSQLSIYAPKIWSVVSQQSFEIHRKQSGDQVGLGHHQIMLSGCHWELCYNENTYSGFSVKQAYKQNEKMKARVFVALKWMVRLASRYYINSVFFHISSGGP